MALTCPHCGTELMNIPQGRDAYRISCPNGIKSPLCDQVDGVIVPCEPNVEMLEALYGGMYSAGEPLQSKIAPARQSYQRMLEATRFPLSESN
jgi:hypothetical protein